MPIGPLSKIHTMSQMLQGLTDGTCCTASLFMSFRVQLLFVAGIVPGCLLACVVSWQSPMSSNLWLQLWQSAAPPTVTPTWVYKQLLKGVPFGCLSFWCLLRDSRKRRSPAEVPFNSQLLSLVWASNTNFSIQATARRSYSDCSFRKL